MRTGNSFAALLALAAGAIAQSTASCDDMEAITETVTAATTVTTCPACNNMPTTGAQPTGSMSSGGPPGPPNSSGGPPGPPMSSAPPNGPSTVHTTVYTTVYTDICSTGFTQNTYTVTESCTGSTPTWSQGSTYMPPGFTTTVTVCTVCNHDNSPTTVTLTVPCTSSASPGGGSVPAGPTSNGPAPTGSAPPPPASQGGSQGGTQSQVNPTETDTSTITETCHGCPKPTSTPAPAITTTKACHGCPEESAPSEYTPGPNAATAMTPLSLAWGSVLLSAVGIIAGGAIFL